MPDKTLTFFFYQDGEGRLRVTIAGQGGQKPAESKTGNRYQITTLFPRICSLLSDRDILRLQVAENGENVEVVLRGI